MARTTFWGTNLIHFLGQIFLASEASTRVTRRTIEDIFPSCDKFMICVIFRKASRIFISNLNFSGQLIKLIFVDGEGVGRERRVRRQHPDGASLLDGGVGAAALREGDRRSQQASRVARIRDRNFSR